jgi:peroxiredoxin
MPVPSRAIPYGAEAPDFTLPSATGGEISLSDYRGRHCVVLVFLRGFM